MARAKIRLVAEEGTIERVIGWSERFCQQHGLSRDVINAVSLSLEEIVSNIVVHGYEQQPGKLLIELHYDRRAFSVVIEDRGKQFDPTRAVTPPTSDTLASRREGGLGLLLVKKLMDDISYQRADGTNRLKLVKYL